MHQKKNEELEKQVLLKKEELLMKAPIGLTRFVYKLCRIFPRKIRLLFPAILEKVLEIMVNTLHWNC